MRSLYLKAQTSFLRSYLLASVTEVPGSVAGITSASDLTVGGGTTVRNVHVEAPISSAGIDEALGIKRLF